MIAALVFLYGLLFGSFFNVAGLRVPAGESVVRPRSACAQCGRSLSVRDLVPVLSYIWLGGKCRTCGAKISLLYPTTELLTALFFLYSFWQYGVSVQFVEAVLLVSLLIILSVSDIAYQRIPNKILLWFFVPFAVVRFIDPLTPWWDSPAGAAVGFGLLFLIALVSKGGMGGGDIKLFALLGFVLGVKIVLLAFFFSCVFGALTGFLLQIFGIVKRGQPVPFAPFIALGTLVAFFHGQAWIDAYVRLFIMP